MLQGKTLRWMGAGERGKNSCVAPPVRTIRADTCQKMTERNVKLSICIATYNRSAKLQRTLAALVQQISRVGGGVIEVVVGDNHSEDGTDRVLMNFSSNHTALRYIRHAKNIGAEKNYESVIQASRGEYVWLLSDDDYVLEGCIEKILDVLVQNRDLHYIFVNYLLWNEALQCVTGPSECVAKKDCRVTGVEQFFLMTRFSNSFVGSNIYKKSSWTECHEAKFFETYWPQLYISCKIVERYCGYVIAEPLMMMGCLPIEVSRAEKRKQGNDHFYMDAHVMYMQFVDYIRFQMLGSDARKLACRQILDANLYQIEHYKKTAAGYSLAYIRSVFADMVRFQALRRSIGFWVMDVPVLFMPRSAFAYFVKYRQFRSDLPTWRNSKEKQKRAVYLAYRMLKLSKRSIKGFKWV